MIEMIDSWVPVRQRETGVRHVVRHGQQLLLQGLLGPGRLGHHGPRERLEARLHLGLIGVQIDLAYDRADGVITLCEMKRQTAPLGKAVIAEVERKAEALRAAYPRRTVQPVLVVDGPVSKEIPASGYFYRIIQASEMLR